MNQLFPRAEDLTSEEIDYEFIIRQQPEHVFKLELSGKQRHLRSLFKEDQKEARNYRSPFSISEEAPHIEGRIENLERALDKKVESKYESRVIHYWYRVKRSVARNDEEKKMRRELTRKIEAVMQNYQFGPSLSPYKFRINKIIQGNEAVGGDLPHTVVRQNQTVRQGSNEAEIATSYGNDSWGKQDDLPRTGTGAIPKDSKRSDHGMEGSQSPEFVVSRQEWEEMKAMMMTLMSRMSGNDHENVSRNSDNNQGRENWRSQSQGQPREMATQNIIHNRVFGERPDSRSSSEDNRSYRTHQPPRCRLDSSDDDRCVEDGSEQRYGVPYQIQPHRGTRQLRDRALNHNRIEKWKLRFTGEPRSMPIENFLYKAKKLADREGVSREVLLRDIHMLLEGAASDWFFTFVDDLDTWEVFETNIVYRFGNPNKDQGIRTKIHERKQLRGEPFIAFVTEIEKLNKMLSRPLSTRRKFEVIWDNMRQHYRSKISIVEVKDLQHLTRLNYRIDAADPQLQYQQTELPARRSINQIEAEGSDYDSDQSAPINAIRGRFGRENRQNQREGHEGRSSQPSSQLQQPERAAHQPVAATTCWNCQGQGHGWRQCNRPKIVFCYGCGNLGRTTRNCERCARNYAVPQAQQQGNE